MDNLNQMVQFTKTDFEQLVWDNWYGTIGMGQFGFRSLNPRN